MYQYFLMITNSRCRIQASSFPSWCQRWARNLSRDVIRRFIGGGAHLEIKILFCGKYILTEKLNCEKKTINIFFDKENIQTNLKTLPAVFWIPNHFYYCLNMIWSPKMNLNASGSSTPPYFVLMNRDLCFGSSNLIFQKTSWGSSSESERRLIWSIGNTWSVLRPQKLNLAILTYRIRKQFKFEKKSY